MAQTGISKLPLLEENFEIFKWSVQEGDTATSAEKGQSAGAITNDDSGIVRYTTTTFYATVWNDMVSRLERALTLAELGWDDTYGTAESCRMVSGQIFRAKYFNAVAWNIQRFGFVQWRWAVTECPGSTGRDQFRGASEAGLAKADKLYAWHILVLIKKMNLLIEVLRGTAPMGEHTANAQIISEAKMAAKTACAAAAAARCLVDTGTPIPMVTARRVNIPLTQPHADSTASAPLLLGSGLLLGCGAVNHSKALLPLSHSYRKDIELRGKSVSYLGAKLQDIYFRGNLLLQSAAKANYPIPMATAQRVNIPLTQLWTESKSISRLTLPTPDFPELAGLGLSQAPIPMDTRQRVNAVLEGKADSYDQPEIRQQPAQPAESSWQSNSADISLMIWARHHNMLLRGLAASYGRQPMEDAAPRSMRMRLNGKADSHESLSLAYPQSTPPAASEQVNSKRKAVMSDARNRGRMCAVQARTETAGRPVLYPAEPSQTAALAAQILGQVFMGAETKRHLLIDAAGYVQGQSAAQMKRVQNRLAAIEAPAQSSENALLQTKAPTTLYAENYGQTIVQHALLARQKQAAGALDGAQAVQAVSLRSQPKEAAQASDTINSHSLDSAKAQPGKPLSAACAADGSAEAVMLTRPGKYAATACGAASDENAVFEASPGKQIAAAAAAQSRGHHTLRSGGSCILTAMVTAKVEHTARLATLLREQLPESSVTSAAASGCTATLERWHNIQPVSDWASQTGTTLEIRRTYYNRMDESIPGRLLIDSAWYAEPTLQDGTLAITSEGYNDYGLEGQDEDKL